MWDRLLEAVDSLGGKFKNKRIAEKTGLSKGTVSEYLNKSSNKEPSENFVRTFCEQFGFDFNDIWYGPQKEKGAEGVKLTDRELIAMFLRISDSQTEILRDIREGMARADPQARIEANLNRVFGGLEEVGERQEKAITQIRTDLARIEGKIDDLS